MNGDADSISESFSVDAHVEVLEGSRL